jgi:hypothetical protein
MKPSPRIREGLRLLLEAYEFAQELRRPVWDFALEIAALRQGGLGNNEFRWLVYQRYLLHAPEEVVLKGKCGPRDLAGWLTLSETSCFVLTSEGASFLRSYLAPLPADGPPGAPPAAADLPQPPLKRPCWDRDRRELRFGDRLVKQYKVPAANQEIILQAFQEEAWPPCIDDPLPPHASIDPKRRLHDTLGSLNRNQKHALIRFFGNGNGEGVRWEIAPRSNQTNGGGAQAAEARTIMDG